MVVTQQMACINGSQTLYHCNIYCIDETLSITQ